MIRRISAVSSALLALALVGSNCGGNPAGPTKTPPDNVAVVISTMTASPPVGVLGVTTFAMTAESTPPPGTTLTFAWDFGDGTRAIGAVVDKAYDRVGDYVASVTVTALRSDGTFAGSASSRQTVQVGLLTGTWTDQQILSRTTLHLTQDGSRLTGTYSSETAIPLLGPAHKWTITADAPGRAYGNGTFEVPTSLDPAGNLHAGLVSVRAARYAYGLCCFPTSRTLKKTSDTP
jgi:hypothetical protein